MSEVVELDHIGERAEAGGNSLEAPNREAAALELIAAHEWTLRRTARRYSLCEEDAEDAFQRASIILWRKAPTADQNELLRWMQIVTKHEALGVRRQRERALAETLDDGAGDAYGDPLDLLVGDAADPAERAERSERVARSREALGALKPHEVRCLLLKAEGYSYREIGRLTGWTHTKVNRLMSEGRGRFLDVFASIESGDRCDQLAPALSALADGELTNGHREEVVAHLHTCSRCRARLRAYRGLPRRLLEVIVPAAPLGHSWWSRLQESLIAGWGERVAGASQKFQQMTDVATAQKAAAAVAVTAATVGGGAAVVADRVDRPPPAKERKARAASLPVTPLPSALVPAPARPRTVASPAKSPKRKTSTSRRGSKSPAARSSAAVAAEFAPDARGEPLGDPRTAGAAVGAPSYLAPAPSGSEPAPKTASGGAESEFAP